MRIGNEEEYKDILYFCDPEKNKKCNKRLCFKNDGPCHSTPNPEYAFISGVHNRPAVAGIITYTKQHPEGKILK